MSRTEISQSAAGFEIATRKPANWRLAFKIIVTKPGFGAVTTRLEFRNLTMWRVSRRSGSRCRGR